MKTAEDFRNEYPAMDDGFRCAVLRTLQDLEQKEVKPVKKKVSFGLVIALAVMLLGTVAVAASIGQWGLNEFWNRIYHYPAGPYISRQANPEASRALHHFENPPTLTTPYGTITIREHAYDGISVYLAIDVEPADGVLLLPDNIYSVDDIIELSIEDSLVTLSVQEFANQTNRPEIVWFIPCAFMYTQNQHEAVFNADGSATFFTQFIMEDWNEILDSFDLYLDFMPYRSIPKKNVTQGSSIRTRSTSYFDLYHQRKLVIPLEYTPWLATATSDIVECAEFGGFSAQLTMIRTHITTYCLIEYPKNGITYEYFRTGFFWPLDKNGQELTIGAWQGPFMNHERFFATASLDEIPDTIHLGYKKYSTTGEPLNSIPFQKLLTFHLTPQPQ